MSQLMTHLPKRVMIQLVPILLALVSGYGGTGSGDFQDDPLSFHQELRQRYLRGEDNRSVIGRLQTDLQEHSFDDLARASPGGKAGLILLYSAWNLWHNGRYKLAKEHYTRARDLFLRAGIFTESRFALYYLAMLAAEQEKYQTCFDLLKQALHESAGRNEPFLNGLLTEGLGYALWYLQRLPESCEAFGKAVNAWNRIKYEPGMVNCWSNLALLFQELDLSDQAWISYRKAIDSLREDSFPDTKFLLFRNYALFHHRNDRPNLAIHYLLRCRDYRDSDESLYQLARAEILDSLKLLEKIQPENKSTALFTKLLRARYHSKRGMNIEAASLLQQVVLESRAAQIPRITREGELALAELLGKIGETDQALKIFTRILEEGHSPQSVDVLLPFSKAAARPVDGIVRCLVKEGRTTKARRFIQGTRLLRSRKGAQFLDTIRDSNRTEYRKILSSSILPLEKSSGKSEWDHTPNKLCGHSTLLELWPDGKEVFVWVDDRSGSHFFKLELDSWIGDEIQNLTAALYSPAPFLVPEPPTEVSNRLFRQLFLPLEGRISGRKLLIIAHKELQDLPFEMLKRESGEYLLESYSFSYLPGIHYLGRNAKFKGPPLLITPNGFEKTRKTAGEKDFLKSLYPDLRILEALHREKPLSGAWIHIASHLNIDRCYWLKSTFSGGDESIPITDFLKASCRCSLLSLGVCEPANSATSASPYWMGLSEIMMLNGAENILTSRWRMDETSSFIYTDFFRLCKQGLPMDEALQRARLKLLEPEKSGLPSWADHPFFWAGITYVGEPGNRLPGSPALAPGKVPLPLFLWMVLISALPLRENLHGMTKSGLNRVFG